MTSRLKKIGFTTAAGLGLFAGAAGIAAAAGSDAPAPAPVAVIEPAFEPAVETEAPGDTGVNCEDGIDSATGAECDGGPAAALADEATETPDAEEDAVAPTGAPAGLVQAPTPASGTSDAATTEPATAETEAPESETGGDEADDGVDHQFEGEEFGENGNGIPDGGDLNGTEADD